ncbi:MAG: TetR family transcriptional regulator [Micromonosporaceae bacterium]|nr:TetR family transcriptional regulator [Micromonosporaceae bacterium]
MATGTSVDGLTRARERVLATAYDLFARRGIRAVGVDEIVASSRVAKATFYRHFPSKDDLVLAFLQRREREWTWGLVEAGARARGSTPLEQLLAIFDVFDEWFARRDDFNGCSFINVLLEMGPEHRVGRACIDYLANIRGIVHDWAAEAGLDDPDGFARSWHILMKGSIISAAEGDTHAARRAQRMAWWLIEDHRSSQSDSTLA